MVPVLAFLAAISGAWYLLIVRPQKAMGDRHASVVGALVVGDCVLTVGGIFGRVVTIEGDSVLLELAPGTTSRIATAGIARIVPAGDAPAQAEPVVAAAAAQVSTMNPQVQQARTMHPHQQPDHGQPHPYQQPQPQPQVAYAQAAPAAAPYVPPIAQPGHAPAQPVAHQQPPVQYGAPQAQMPRPAAHMVQQQVQPPTFGAGSDGGNNVLRAIAAPQVQPLTQFREVPALELPPVPNLFAPRPWRATAPVGAQQVTPHYDPPTFAAGQHPSQHAQPHPQAYGQQPHPANAQPPQVYAQPQQVVPDHQMAQQQQQQPTVHPQPVQHHVDPHVMQATTPMPQVDEQLPPTGRRRSQAPSGMGSSVRIEGELERTFDRARAERAELAEEYRLSMAPLVAQPDIAVAHQPQPVVSHDGQQLFVHGQVQQHAVTAFPPPANVPQMVVGPDGMAAFGVPGAVNTMPAPLNADGSQPFQRRTPYSPQVQQAAGA